MPFICQFIPRESIGAGCASRQKKIPKTRITTCISTRLFPSKEWILPLKTDLQPNRPRITLNRLYDHHMVQPYSSADSHSRQKERKKKDSTLETSVSRFGWFTSIRSRFKLMRFECRTSIEKNKDGSHFACGGSRSNIPLFSQYANSMCDVRRCLEGVCDTTSTPLKDVARQGRKEENDLHSAPHPR